MDRETMKRQKLTEAEHVAELATGKDVDARYGKTGEARTKKVLEGEKDDFLVDEQRTNEIAEVLENDRADFFHDLAAEELKWLRSVYGEAFRHIQRESTGSGYSQRARDSLEAIYRGQRENFLGSGRTDFSTEEQKEAYSEATESLRSPAELVANLQQLALKTGTPDLGEAREVAEDAAMAHAKIGAALETLEENGYPRLDLYQEERTAMQLYRTYMPQPV
ncbi:MAG: hypothetical protein ABEJ98_02905 [Candidatus Nanohaloarchaea archaeon]